mgnify:CR=1 FL=1
MIRLNLFMIWFLHFLSLLSVICRYYRQNSSSRIIVVLVYTVSHIFFLRINREHNIHISLYHIPDNRPICFKSDHEKIINEYPEQ